MVSMLSSKATASNSFIVTVRRALLGKHLTTVKCGYDCSANFVFPRRPVPNRVLLRLLSCPPRRPFSSVGYSPPFPAVDLPLEFHESLSSLLPPENLSSNPYELLRHCRGESHVNSPNLPSLVVHPRHISDVVDIMKLCTKHNVCVVPFGGGTSLEGHVSVGDGCRPTISLDMGLMDSINYGGDNDDGCSRDFYAERMSVSGDKNHIVSLPVHGTSVCKESEPIFDVTIGPAVTRPSLNAYLRHTGLNFMVDPGAPTATIAGMVACGASGTSAVKYGTIRDNVLACTIVLADGSIVNVGTRSLKNSAGFDLRGLICGSEGTLGVIVSLTVRLHPLPGCTTAVVADFECLRGAANAVGEVVAGCPGALARCELLDEMSVQAFNQYISSRDNATVEDALQERPHLFLEFEGPTDDVVTAYVKVATEILNDHGCMTLKTASGEKERRDLWSARHSLYYAALALRGGDAAGFVTDACVPLGSLPDLIEATTEDVKRLGVVGPCFGHAGDGNFHCILPILEGDSEKYRAAVNEVNDNLIRRTMRAGGSCTGEHGVGVGKVKYLEWQYGAGACEMMKAIKMAVDPKNIMNPGKIVMHD